MKKEDYESLVIESSNNAIIAIDWTTKITTYNQKAVEMFGWTKQEMIGTRNLLNIVPSKYKDMHSIASKVYLHSGQSCGAIDKIHELEGISKEGKIFPIQISFGAKWKPKGAIVVANIVDITDKRNAENTLKLLNNNLKDTIKDQTLELAKSISIMSKYTIFSKTNEKGIITEVSDAFCKISGYRRSELVGHSHNIVRHPDVDSSIFKDMWSTISEGETWSGEVKNLKKDGGFYWVIANIEPEFNTNGDIKGYISIRQDITDKKELEYISVTDSLTSLYNRRYFDQIFPKQINIAKRDRKKLVFAMLDIDFFKQYNDTYGHQQGDVVLKKVSHTIQKLLSRASDYSFRLGGEEFGIIFRIENDDDGYNIASKINQNIENLKIEHKNNSASQYITLSIGVFIVDSMKQYTVENIYKEADEALYKAKNNGRNQVVLSDDS